MKSCAIEDYLKIPTKESSSHAISVGMLLEAVV